MSKSSLFWAAYAAFYRHRVGRFLLRYNQPRFVDGKFVYGRPGLHRS